MRFPALAARQFLVHVLNLRAGCVEYFFIREGGTDRRRAAGARLSTTFMARYLLTGAAGFIASRVAQLLLDDGHVVLGLDNLNDAYDVRLKTWRLDQLRRHERFLFRPIDILDRGSLRAGFEGGPGFDAVLHLAARTGVRASVEDPWSYLQTNVEGTLNLLELCRDRAPKFVLASTSSLYGAGNPLPYQETVRTDRPLSPYAASKKAAEALCHSYHHLHGIDVTVLRYFTVYGPAGRPDMSVFRFVRQIVEGETVVIHGDGSQSRDFTFVDDIAEGTVAALRTLGCGTINLGSDSPASVTEVIRLIERLVGRHAVIQYRSAHRADVQATWAGVEKARRLLDWRPTVSLEEGLGRTVSWYHENREWASRIEIESGRRKLSVAVGGR